MGLSVAKPRQLCAVSCAGFGAGATGERPPTLKHSFSCSQGFRV